MSPRTRFVAPSEWVRAGSTLTSPDYVDAVVVDPVRGGRTAEQWARLVLEEAPVALRRFLFGGWRYGLALRLGPYPAPGYVLGWRIVDEQADRVTLAARSPLLGTAELVLGVAGERVTLATFLIFRQPAARVAWAAAIGPLHRRIVPVLLGAAARTAG